MNHRASVVRIGFAGLLALAAAMPAFAGTALPPAAKPVTPPAAQPAPPPVKKLTTAVPAPAPPAAAQPAPAPATRATPAHAAPAAESAPAPGQMWIRPFPASKQNERSTRAYDDYWMAVGRLTGEAQAEKVEMVGGKWSHAVYTAPAGASVAEVFRHYEQQVAKTGLELMYTCKGLECGEGGRKTNGDWWWLSEHRRYLAARLKRPGGDLWVSVHVHAGSATAPVRQELDVVEAKPPAIPPPQRNEADAATLTKELKADGRVVLRSIGFVEGRPTVLPASEPVVQAIADLLSRDQGLKLHVVVHSDDSAPSAASMDLTKKRAAALVSMLTRKYRVPSSRVQASGVGLLAPVANNATGEGRALNRRVELVPQGGRTSGHAASARR